MVKRREGRFTVRLYVGLTEETGARIREASERYSVAEAVIARRAIEFGLNRALDSVRRESEGRGGRGGA